MPDEQHSPEWRLKAIERAANEERLKLKEAEQEQDAIKGAVGALTVALFGHPQDKLDSGIVGQVSETNSKMDGLNIKVDKIIWGLFSLLATGVVAVVIDLIKSSH